MANEITLSDENTTCNVSENIEQFTQDGFRILIEATKAANRLPCGLSRDLYESYPSFQRVTKEQGEKVLNQLSRVLKYVGIRGNIVRREDDEKFEMLVDANDTIFERVGTMLDEMAGIRRNPDPNFNPLVDKLISGSWNKTTIEATRAVSSSAINNMLSASKNLAKPQTKFAVQIDNSKDTPFTPRIKYKHNLLKPLALFEIDGQFTHPYEFELEKFEPREKWLAVCQPCSYKSLNETKFTFVDDKSQIQEMLNHLKSVDEIAVDLEHHHYRSYQGFTCLMQISSRTEDFVIDTLALRDDLEPLNEVFTDPNKLKVFHGASMDICWLQRDLSLYVVNMFDTYIAAKSLNYPRLSLAFLLAKFCDVQAMKHFQLADWRVRPIPDEMLKYAREDTHYLLYIADLLRNELIDQANGSDNLLKSVFKEGTQTCLTRYVKPIWTENEYLQLYVKSKRLFDNRQLNALKNLFDWRDCIAREFDESLRLLGLMRCSLCSYVLPNHMLLHIAENLPREMQGILACCNPVPPLVRQHLTQLHQMVLRARNLPHVAPEADLSYPAMAETHHTFSSMRCPHDLTWEPDFRPDLSVLLNNTGKISKCKENSLYAAKGSVTVFETGSSLVPHKTLTPTVLTPYQRFKLSKKYIASTNQLDFGTKQINQVAETDKMSVGQTKHNTMTKEKQEELTDLIAQDIKNDVISLKEKKKADLPLEKRKRKSTKITEEKPVKKSKLNATVQNFDYTSVDYNKFQSGRQIPATQRHNTKHKRGKKGRFKIAI